MIALRRALFATACLLASVPSTAQEWVSINPGAGGQIQSVVLDPVSANHAYVLSDVEGMYKTTDGGATYRPVITGLTSPNTLALAVDPGNANRLYLGTDRGLHVSSNGGASWTPSPSFDRSRSDVSALVTRNRGGGTTERLHIGSVVVNPRNRQQVAAGLGYRRFDQSQVPRAAVFYSRDGGNEFAPVTLDGQSEGDENILQLAVSQDLLFAAANDGGLWASSTASDAWGTSWREIAGPSGFGTNGRVTGVAVSEDGYAVYAAFGQRGQEGTQVYTARLDGATVGAWTRLQATRPAPTDENPTFYNLKVSPFTRADGVIRHLVLTAPLRGFPRDGLSQIVVTWTGDTASGTWQQIFDYESTRFTFSAPLRSDGPYAGFDEGYEGNEPNTYDYAFSPASWEPQAGRQIWTTGDQTLFKTRTNAAGAPLQWAQIYTRQVGSVSSPGYAGGIQTYADRGWSSTVDFDGDQFGPFACASKADHALAMSYDGGESWEVRSQPQFLTGGLVARSNACRFVEAPSGRLFVLAHLTAGFSADALGGELWAMELDATQPGPSRWTFLAGGGDASTARGLPNLLIDYIEQNPADRGQVALSLVDASFSGRNRSLAGVYLINDIDALYDGGASARVDAIWGRGTQDQPLEKDNAVRFDPNAPGVLFVNDRSRVLRLTGGGRSWSVQSTVCPPQSRTMKMDVWDNAGKTMVACRFSSRSGGRDIYSVSVAHVTPQGAVDRDPSGALTQAQLEAVPHTPLMTTNPATREIWSIAGYGSTVYVNIEERVGGFIGYGIGYGVFAATVGPTGRTSSPRNISSGFQHPSIFRLRAVAETGNLWLVAATWGAGTWRYPVDGSIVIDPDPDPDPTAPVPGVWYTVRNADHSLVLASNAGGSTFSRPASDDLDRQWQVIAGADGAFLIDNREAGRGPLETSPPSTVRWVGDGSPGTPTRLWTITPDGTGAVRIESVAPGTQYLRANPDGGTFYDGGPKVGTRWEFIPVEEAPDPDPPATGPQPGTWYLLVNADRGDRNLDSGGEGSVTLKSGFNGDDRQWRFVADGGAFAIDNRALGRGPLDTSSGGSVRWTPDGTPLSGDKLWDVVDNGDGTVRLRNRRSGAPYLVGNGDGSVGWTAAAGAGTRWRYVVASAQLSEDRDEARRARLPETFTLDAVGPNPTRGDVRVQFGLPEAADVAVEVVDIQGRRVAASTVAYGAGWQDASVSTSGFAPGVYVLRLRAGAETLSRRFTIAR